MRYNEFLFESQGFQTTLQNITEQDFLKKMIGYLNSLQKTAQHIADSRAASLGNGSAKVYGSGAGAAMEASMVKDTPPFYLAVRMKNFTESQVEHFFLQFVDLISAFTRDAADGKMEVTGDKHTFVIQRVGQEFGFSVGKMAS